MKYHPPYGKFNDRGKRGPRIGVLIAVGDPLSSHDPH